MATRRTNATRIFTSRENRATDYRKSENNVSVCNEIYLKAEKNTIETIIETIILYGRQCLSQIS